MLLNTQAKEQPSAEDSAQTRRLSRAEKRADFGRYHLLERIAVGGMAEIFKAKLYGDHGFEKTLVIKRMLPHLARDQEFVDMFIDEARVMGRLNHPKIVQVLDYGTVNDRSYIAMEYVAGTDCLAVLQQCAKQRRRTPMGVAIQIIAEVLDALEYAHNLRDDAGEPLHIVHRDISPSNIFISSRGDVKLGDFGIVRVAARRGTTQVGILKGKYGYMAPEQVSGQITDHRSDIFSAGIVLAELLMNRRLFTAKADLDVLLQVRDARLDRLDRFGKHIPGDLREILEAALARDPALRYQDAATFRDALLYYLFDNRRMVHNAQVRRFLRRLEHEQDDTVSHSIGDPTPGAVEGTDNSGDDVTAVAKPVPEPDTSRVDEPRKVGRKRKIVFAPPPAPLVPQGLNETREEPRLPTDDAIAALPELQPSPSPPDLHVEVTARRLLDQAGSEMTAERVVADRSRRSPTPASSEQQGDLAQQSLFRVLFRLATNEETGLLVLRSKDVVREIYLVDGHPQSVTSNRAEELFGQYLVRNGVISDGELSMALAVLPKFNGHLGDSLVGLRLLTPMEVLRHLTHQVRQRVLDAFQWSEGSYEYHGGRRAADESAPLGLDAFELMGAGIFALAGDAVVQRAADLMDRRIRLVDPPPVPPEVFRFGSLTRQVCADLKRSASLKTLTDEIDDRARRILFIRVVYLLVETGLAEAE